MKIWVVSRDGLPDALFDSAGAASDYAQQNAGDRPMQIRAFVVNAHMLDRGTRHALAIRRIPLHRLTAAH